MIAIKGLSDREGKYFLIEDRLIADVTPARGRKVFQNNDLLKF